MKILILGATGMLGNTLFRVFSSHAHHETWGTLRDARARRFFAEAHGARLIDRVDVTDQDALVSVMNRVRPDVVINAVGVIKQLAASNDPLVVLPINAIFPHRLAGLCALAGARLILISSDCVFAGDSGGYVESDPSDADDLYGKSKYMGEVHDQPHVITLRTSGIGHELNSRHGLLEWFLAEEGSVRGFAEAIYSGLTWIELARVIEEHVLSHWELEGLFHVSSQPISKLGLLRIIRQVYDKEISIEPDNSVRIDRSLDSTRFAKATDFVPVEWPRQIADMHKHRLAQRDSAHV